MKKKIVVLLIVLTVIGVFLGTKLINLGLSNNELITAGVAEKVFSTSSPTTTPTPTPLVFDRNSNLSEELEKITPEDFNRDFKILKEEVSQF